eukprot:TRINITY_DN26588_c0_g1_i1.p1 TRINITY_DN26588_c0_g1~~TRINITY_DN26588_c0_g1_i1.p1  ORF type:complete len:131 (+),score=5.77 TRINITY_DN26588_c0_g1_i1:59-451(+)
MSVSLTSGLLARRSAIFTSRAVKMPSFRTFSVQKAPELDTQTKAIAGGHADHPLLAEAKSYYYAVEVNRFPERQPEEEPEDPAMVARRKRYEALSPELQKMLHPSRRLLHHTPAPVWDLDAPLPKEDEDR